ncbi:MAG: hypothetical protein EOO42_15360 [Flavobacteriales bacterium]|nr:MAG: hypothetical protein EOO42_15360 [Flavobacteriales bacterium]
MKENLIRTVLFGVAVSSLILGSCSKNDDPGTNPPVENGTRWITLTGAYPDPAGTAGNGGTRAYAITQENAANPSYEVDLFKMDGEKYVVGFGLKSSRTARVQASEDGKYLYNIQYTGTEGGVFNKYQVSGEGKFAEVGYELNTSVILGTSPRWVKAAEGIGVGVSFGEALDPYTGSAPNYVWRHPKGKIKIANIDLNNTAITNTGNIDVDLGAELEAKGYHIWRADVPILNQAKDKLFIGVGIRKHNINGTVTYNNSGVINGWQTENLREFGTVTYVVDYPSLRNPKIITSSKANTDNLSYRTMTQYLGTDGHIYQAATSMGSGSQILRISKSTNDYDNSYELNLNTALGITDAGIRAFRYVKDGIGVVLYTRTSIAGGFVALVDLSAKSATKVNIDMETQAGLSTTFGQFQNIGLVGDNIYLPLTASGLDGNIYIINYKTKTVTKGAKLKNASGSFYLGAY